MGWGGFLYSPPPSSPLFLLYHAFALVYSFFSFSLFVAKFQFLTCSHERPPELSCHRFPFKTSSFSTGGLSFFSPFLPLLSCISCSWPYLEGFLFPFLVFCFFHTVFLFLSWRFSGSSTDRRIERPLCLPPPLSLVHHPPSTQRLL